MKKYFYDIIRYKFFKFGGRAGRKEFWLFQLWYTLILFFLYAGFLVPAFFVMDAEEANTLLSGLVIFFAIDIFIFLAATILPSIALFVRRLHDAGLSGWLVLLLAFFPPIGIIYGLLPPSLGANKYDE